MTWTTIGEYIEALSRIPTGINDATNGGHSALRIWAMGERAFEHAAADEISVMGRTLEEGVRAGRIGLTAATTSSPST
ncbi:MAG: hypothetical protein ABW328_14355 [Ilumatobacteraceae bacterium]